MVYAYDAGSQVRLAGPVANAIGVVSRRGVFTRMASRVSRAAARTAASGSCGAGCWLERGADGKEYCYCGDTGARMQGATDHSKSINLLLGLAAIGAGFAIYNKFHSRKSRR